MQRLIIALASGLIFGAGLVISEMANPVKVQNFLDPFGHWDPQFSLRYGWRCDGHFRHITLYHET